ncbi:MAG: tetratricopeptide repeat protein [Pseudomonadota bacterium]
MRAYQQEFSRIFDLETVLDLETKLTPEAARLLLAKSAQYMFIPPEPSNTERIARLIKASSAAEDTVSLAHLHYASGLRTLRAGGDTVEIERQLQTSIDYAKTNGMSKLLPSILNAMAVRAKFDGNYAEAVERYREAMAAYESAGVYAGAGVVQANIANIFSDLNDHQTAIDYYRNALAVYREHVPDNHELIAISTLNMGTAHVRLGEYERAAEVFAEAREIIAKMTSRRLDGLLNYQNARALFEIGQTDRAIKMAELSVSQTLENRDPAEAAVALNWLAQRYMERGDTAAARTALSRAREIIEPEGEGAEGLAANPGNKYWALEYAREMGALLTQLGEPEAAAPYYEAALSLSEDRFESEKMQAMANADLLFDLRDSESSLELMRQEALVSDLRLRQSELRSWIGLLIAMLTGLAAFAIYRSYRSQRRLAVARDTFLKETHHRTKNNLQLLSSLLRLNALQHPDNESFGNKSADLADRARMMALVNDHLYAHGDEPKASVNAKSFLTDLLHLLQNSLGREGVVIESNIADIDLDADKAIPVGLFVSETITNAFKYAFGESGGKISVEVTAPEEGRFVLTVADTGKGFDIDEARKARSGVGISIIDDLAAQLSGKVDVATDENGTQWRFDAPIGSSSAMSVG